VDAVTLTEFKYSEALLADRLQLSRTDLKFLRDRHLQRDSDWKKVRHGEVLLSASGLKTIWKKIGAGRRHTIELTEIVVGSEIVKKNGVAASDVDAGEVPIALGDVRMPIPRKMTVTAIPLNPMVVNAVDEHSTRVLVWVGRNANFVVGDTIDAAPHLTQPGLWRFLGTIPRDRRRVKGKWL
jgi:hypothetical protein